ncbi:energy transducer TonB [Pontibacter sp. G13]|uniref:energy transducer TonB n=1 Tax=Pontibacter sp. G13 TaxID=3074898 RepID=UPI002889E961|nr:energy transducer TonB [Pontibacter sp. G13]WNJ16432.1 energy transducer TonB [Pontibacter sp. G13]
MIPFEFFHYRLPNPLVLIVLFIFQFPLISFGQEDRKNPEIMVSPEPLFDTTWANGRIIAITALKKIEKTAPYWGNGEDDFLYFVGSNLAYPEDAKLNGIEGGVTVVLTVHEDGSTSIFDVFDIGFGTKEEAIRLIELSGCWNPAINKETGLPIQSTILVPIPFKLN